MCYSAIELYLFIFICSRKIYGTSYVCFHDFSLRFGQSLIVRTNSVTNAPGLSSGTFELGSRGNAVLVPSEPGHSCLLSSRFTIFLIFCSVCVCVFFNYFYYISSDEWAGIVDSKNEPSGPEHRSLLTAVPPRTNTTRRSVAWRSAEPTIPKAPGSPFPR